MPKKATPDLFGKTFDQQLLATGGRIQGKDLTPNKIVPGSVVLEPLPTGIRVTARDDAHHVLWGFVASRDMLKETHCPVAVYERLREILNEQFEVLGQPTLDQPDPVKAAEERLDLIGKQCESLRSLLKVKKASEATRNRAVTIASASMDALRILDSAVSTKA